MHSDSISELLEKHLSANQLDNYKNFGKKELYDDLMLNISHLQSKYTILPVGMGDANNPIHLGEHMSHPSMLPLSHSHFINYSGGYYTYLYAKLWSAQLWCNLFEKQPLSRESGLYLWDKLLRHGAAEDPLFMLESLGNGDGQPLPLSAKYYMRMK